MIWTKRDLNWTYVKYLVYKAKDVRQKTDILCVLNKNVYFLQHYDIYNGEWTVIYSICSPLEKKINALEKYIDPLSQASV